MEEKTIDDLSVRAQIAERKLDYLFNKNIQPDLHNTPRAIGNAKQMRRIGLWNTFENRTLLRQHFESVFADSKNIVQQVGTKSVRESFFMGPTGSVKFITVWDRERLMTIEPHGGTEENV